MSAATRSTILPASTTTTTTDNRNQEVLDVFVNHLGKDIQQEHEDFKYLKPLKDELEQIRLVYNKDNHNHHPKERLATLQIATDWERKDDTMYYFALPKTARKTTIPITNVAKLQCFVADAVKGRESLTCGYELFYQAPPPQDAAAANNNNNGSNNDQEEEEDLALCYPITQYVKVVGAITGCRGKKKQIQHMIQNKRHVNFFRGLDILVENEENEPNNEAAIPAQFRRGVGRELLGGVFELRFLVVHRTVIDPVLTLLESFAAAAAEPSCTTTIATTSSSTSTLMNTLYQMYPRCPSLGRIVQQQGEIHKWKATRDFLQSIRVSISENEDDDHSRRTEDLFTLSLPDGIQAPPPSSTRSSLPNVATWHGKEDYPAIPLSAIRTLKIQVGSRILVDRKMQPASAFSFQPAGGGFFLHCGPTQTTILFLMENENNRNVMTAFGRNPSFLNRVERTMTPTFYLDHMAPPIAGAMELEGFSVKLRLVQTQMKHLKLEALGIELAS